jgi:hypothetical protein
MELWVTKLPASAHATPMTFRGRKTGRQFVVIAAGGGNKYSQVYSDSLIAYALPTGPSDAPLVTYSRAVAREAAASSASAVVPGQELFNHKRHATLKLKCTYCHQTASSGERAGLPSAATCITCHPQMSPDKVVPVARIYRLPDFVFFKHSCHVNHGLDCSVCHGDVWSQVQMRPALQMKMKACTDCHRTSGAKITCTACHELSQ